MSYADSYQHFQPEFIYIEKKALHDAMVRNINRMFPNALVYEIDDHRRLDACDVPLKDFTREAKSKVLVLARNPGGFIREFQRSLEATEQKEFFVAHANGCTFDCQYCYLQCYFAHSAPVLFVNQDDLFEELLQHIQKAPAGTLYHAGELSDALALEAISGFAARATAAFSHNPHVSLELRTKCGRVETLVPAHPPQNVIISWTLTPNRIAGDLEHGAPPIEERMQSAARCQETGYRVGIRFDPMIRYEDWETGYEELVASIFTTLAPEKIASFVLGGFRYLPALATRIRTRFPASPLLLDEFVPCSDGKLRYFRPLRVELYRTVVQEIRRFSAHVPILLCMETAQVCRDVPRQRA